MDADGQEVSDADDEDEDYTAVDTVALEREIELGEQEEEDGVMD